MNYKTFYKCRNVILKEMPDTWDLIAYKHFKLSAQRLDIIKWWGGFYVVYPKRDK